MPLITSSPSAVGYAGPTRPTPSGSPQVVLKLDDAAGTTSITNTGSGTAFVLNTVTGTIAFDTPMTFGGGMYVNGTGDIKGSGTACTYQATTQNFSAFCWVKFQRQNTLGSAGHTAVMFGKPGTAGRTFAIQVMQDTGQLRCAIETASGGATNVDGGFVTTDLSLIGMTYDGTTVKTYINGILIASSGANTGNLVWDNADSWQVGNDANNAYFILRECLFWNSVLTLSDIKTLYTMGAFGR